LTKKNFGGNFFFLVENYDFLKFTTFCHLFSRKGLNGADNGAVITPHAAANTSGMFIFLLVQSEQKNIFYSPRYSVFCGAACKDAL